MRYQESDSESAQFLRMVVPLMSNFKLSATPVNYAVFYEYVAATNDELRSELDGLINAKELLTNELVEEIYEKYFVSGQGGENRYNDLLGLVGKLFDSASVAGNEATKFTQSLQHFDAEMRQDNVNDVQLRIIENLIRDTRSMQTATLILKTQLEDSKREINELQGKLQQVRKESIRDPLTGLVNRKGLAGEMDRLVSGNDPRADCSCLLMLDIDHFKKVNDTYGHVVGDKVIQFVSESLKKQVKGKDIVARFGGEEYAILLFDTNLEGARTVAENIRSTIEKTRIKRTGSGESIAQVTISVGVAKYRDGESAEEFLDRADDALYRSKNGGRNRVSVEELDTRVTVGI